MHVTCPSCRRTLATKPEHAGKAVRCPCNEIVKIPHDDPSASFGSTGGDLASAAPSPTSPKTYTQKCSCGVTLRVPEKALGKNVKCPCGNTFVAAAPATGYSQTQAALGVSTRTSTPQQFAPQPIAAPAPIPSQNDWLSEIPPAATSYAAPMSTNYGASSYVSAADSSKNPYAVAENTNAYLANDYIKNAEKERREKKRERQPGQSWEGHVFNGSVLGGLGAMAVACIWFFVGLACGYIFFYPPVLFIIGLVGFLRGLIDGD